MFDLLSTLVTTTTTISVGATAPGPSGVNIATLVIAACAAVASFFAARSAIEAARIAGEAQTETTRLAAKLADVSELERWRRDHLFSVIAELVQVSYTIFNTRWDEIQYNDVVVNGATGRVGQDALERRNQARDRVISQFDRLVQLTREAQFIGSRQLSAAANALLRVHSGYKPDLAHSTRSTEATRLNTLWSDAALREMDLIALAREELGLESDSDVIFDHPLLRGPSAPSTPDTGR